MGKPAEEIQRVTNEGAPPKYFHMMLNMADDDLNPYQYRLLGHYLRWAGHGGEITQGIRETAKVTQMSVNKIRSTREELVRLGYLKVFTPTKDEQIRGMATLIVVVDRWAENVARYAHPVSNMTHPPVSNMIQVSAQTCVKYDTPPVSNMTPMNNYTEELKEQERTLSATADGDPFKTFIEGLPIEDDPAPKPERPRDPIFDAIAETWKITAGGMIGQIKAMMLGKAKKGEWAACNFEPPATAEEITAFGRWYKAEADGLSLPTAPMKIQKWFYQYREQRPKFRRVILPAEPLPELPPVDDDGDAPTAEELHELVGMLSQNFIGGY